MKTPQFYIRDLIWLMLVVAALCGWWMQQGRVAESRRQLIIVEKQEHEAQRLAEYYSKIIDAYRRDGRLHDAVRPDGSVYVTDEKVTAGFGPPPSP